MIAARDRLVALPAADPVLLGTLFAAAVAVRVALAGPAGASSRPAALVFAALLAGGVLAVRCGVGLTRSSVAIGLLGGGLLAVPALAHQGWSDLHPSGYLPWAVATAVVATAEEAFLRGALFAALDRWRGTGVAVVGAAIAFAGLHVPFYGWHAVPVDLAVGLLLGALRVWSGGWAAPAVAHVGADLVGWWLV